MSNQNTLAESVSGRSTLFDRVAKLLFIVFLALSPLFFIPFLQLPVDLSKIYFLALGITLAFIAWVIARLVDGAITFPKSPIIWVSLLLPATFFISALFSPAPRVSFAGTSLGIGSVAVITLLVLAFLGSTMYLGTPRRLSLFFKVLLGSMLVVTLFQIAYIFLGARFLNFGTFFGSTSNLIGRWNDFGIFFGAIAISAIVLLEVATTLSRGKKIALWLLLVLSFFFLALVNFTLLWGVLAAFAVILLVYSLAVLRPRGEEPRTHFPVAPFVAVLVALLFLIANPIVGTVLPRFFGIGQAEVRPSIAATTAVTWDSLKKSPIVGVGPNRFSNAWMMYRPNQVIATDFWASSFNSGFGLLPSFVATTGILGSLALLAFLLLYLIAGALHVFRAHERKETQALMILTFTLSLYAWVLVLIYNPGIIGVLAAFLFSGAFVGLLAHTGILPMRRASFLEDPRKSFFAILGLVAILIFSLIVLFVGAEKFIALTAYAKGIAAAQNNNMSLAEQKLSQAVSLDPSDTYYRGLVTLRLSQIQTLVNTKDISQDVLKQNFQTLFTAAEKAAQSAVQYDKTNPDNWTTLAGVYSAVVPFGVEGAYTSAKTAYDEAGKLSPNNPGFDLLRAQLEISNKDLAQAKTLTEKAISAKPNLVSAYILLAQIDAAGGNTEAAEKDLEQAVMVAPNDAGANLELGLFKYRAGNYEAAVPLLERSLIFDRSSTTAAYFLGLSYEKVGKTQNALGIFTALTKSFPNDTALAKIVENLKAGKTALDGLATTPPAEVQKEEDKKATTSSKQ
jgi:tetratricopeptide (TPR) repeat protein